VLLLELESVDDGFVVPMPVAVGLLVVDWSASMLPVVDASSACAAAEPSRTDVITAARVCLRIVDTLHGMDWF
jgi:hypothetical protein